MMGLSSLAMTRQVLVERIGLLSALALLVLLFGILSNAFFSARTLVSIANQIPDLTLIAVGMTLVLISGGIDLSVGSVLALCSAVVGVLMVDTGAPLTVALSLALLAGHAALTCSKIELLSCIITNDYVHSLIFLLDYKCG